MKRKLSLVFAILVLTSFLTLLPPPIGVVEEEAKASPNSENLICHQEIIAIAGVNYYRAKLNIAADNTGTTLSVATNDGRHLLGRFVYPLNEISAINASLLTFRYRAYQDMDADVHLDVDILVRADNGSIRNNVATNVANTSELPYAQTTFATYTATYSFAGYTRENASDYLEIAIFADVTTSALGYVFLRIDDNTLAVTDQTASENWSFVFAGESAPEILEIVVDNSLIDRKKDFENSNAIEATRIRVKVRDINGRDGVVKENVKISIKDNEDVLQVENATATSEENLTTTEKYFYYVYNPSDTLASAKLGSFDIRVSVYDNTGLGDNEDFTGMGNALFLVDDLTVTINIDNTSPPRFSTITVSGAGARVKTGNPIKLENVWVVDSYEGSFTLGASSDNTYSKSYVVNAPLFTDVGVYAAVENNTLDGKSSTITYTVQEQQQLSRTVSEDAYTYNYNPDTNYGTLGKLEVATDRYAFLKFNVSGAGEWVIANAKLWIYEHPDFASGSVIVRITGIDNDNWSENAITWNNKPSAPVTNIGDVSVSNTNTWVTFSNEALTNFVNAQRKKDNTVTLELRTTIATLAYFASKEYGSSYASYLELTAKPIQHSPVDGAKIIDNTPTFIWSLGADNYNRLIVDNDDTFSSPEIDVQLGANVNSYTPTSALPDENYSWKIIADNVVSGIWTFVIDTSPPIPILPKNRHVENKYGITFQWSIQQAAVVYHIQIDNENSFASPHVHENLVIPTVNYLYTFTSKGVYYWRIRAGDNKDNWGKWSVSFRLTVGTLPTVTTHESSSVTYSSMTLNSSINYYETPDVDARFRYRYIFADENWRLAHHYYTVPQNPADNQNWGGRTPLIKIAAPDSSQSDKDNADNVGGGSTIQWHINNLSASGGGKVYLFNGTYDLTTNLGLMSNVSLIGASRDDVILNEAASDIGYGLIDIDAQENVLIENLTVRRSGWWIGVERNTIHFGRGKNIVIRNTKCVNAPAIGIYGEATGQGEAEAVENIWIVKNYIENAGAGGIAFSRHQPGGIVRNIYIDNNYILFGGRGNSKYPWGGHGIGFWGVENGYIVNNVVEKAGNAGIVITVNYDYGDLESENILVQGNLVQNCGFGFGKRGGIEIGSVMYGKESNPVENVTVKGNKVLDYSVDNTWWGITITAEGTETETEQGWGIVKNVKIENNDLVGVKEPIKTYQGNFGVIENVTLLNNVGLWENTAWEIVTLPSYSKNASDLAKAYYYEYQAQIKAGDYENNGDVVPKKLTFFPLIYDGYIENSGASYTTVRDATTGTVYAAENQIFVGQGASDNRIQRGYLHFDTSEIPDNALVISAVLLLYGSQDSSITDFDIVLQNGQPDYPHIPLTAEDFDRTKYSGDGGSFNTSKFFIGNYNDIQFNDNGISWINPVGYTKLCLRSSRDIAGNAPTNDEFVAFWAKERGTDISPTLIVRAYTSLAPSLLSPANFSRITDNTPTFVWRPGIGAENNRILVDNDSNMQSPIDNVLLGGSVENWTKPENGYPCGTYYWQVITIRATENSPSSIWTFTVIPPKPVLFSPENNKLDNQLTQTFRWTRSDNISSPYHLRIDNELSITSPFVFEKTDVADNTYTYTLPKSDNYYWTVRVKKDGIWSDWADWFKLTVISEVPGKPTLTSPENNASLSAASITFTWTPKDNLIFHIQIDNENSFASPYIYENDNISDNSYIYNFAQTGIYYWRVRARNIAGWSEWSDNFKFTLTALGSPPTKPALQLPPDGTFTNDNTPSFSWTQPENADNVRLQLDDDNAFSSPEINVLLPPTTTSYTASELLDKKYYWRVLAINSYGENSSDVWNLTIDTVPPGKPTLYQHIDGWFDNDNTPLLSWIAASDNASGVKDYRVEIDNDSNFGSLEESATITTTYYQVVTQLAQATWYWRVRASDKAGNIGAWDNNWFRIDITPPAAPILLSPANNSSTTNRKPTFLWTEVSDPATPVTYHLQVDNDSDFGSTVISTPWQTSTSFTPTSDLPNENYYWRVRAKDSAGGSNIGPWSSTWVLEIYFEIPPEEPAGGGTSYIPPENVPIVPREISPNIFWIALGGWIVLVVVGGQAAIRKKKGMKNFYLLAILSLVLLVLALNSLGVLFI